ncbi:MAG: glycosyltransferase family 9 protein [Enterobacterales bacterium]|nr:glycosyltransferase family 9 protein [Enterobacterales bacterium]
MTKAFDSPNTICILRLSAIGDVCHAIAGVQAIKDAYPKAKISWVIGRVEYQLMRHLIEVDWVVFDKKQGLKAYKELYQRFKGHEFDILLHMQVALRASLASLCISAKQKWGFDSARAKEGQWLFTNRQIPAQNQPHVAEGFWGFAKAIGAGQSDKPSWPTIKANQYPISALLQHSKQPFVVISPAASNSVRNWLPQRYAAIADYLVGKGFNVVLTGGPSSIEKELSEKIIKTTHQAVTNLVGQTSLIELLSVIEQARFIIAPDSGPAHMACLVDTPVIGLYAHSNPQEQVLTKVRT